MKKWVADTNDFYVGYFPKAPKGIASIVRKIILSLFVLMIVLAFILGWQQKQFSTTSFEYGIPTDIEGYVFKMPVPHILMPLGKDLQQNELYQTVLLVSSRKAGANNLMSNVSSGSKVKLTGYLIYGDGKALLQVDEKSIMKSIETEPLKIFEPYKETTVSLAGEVVDPKCYFGVMKPGEGKAHRSCAIRCIAGGIPPVLKTASGYFLLLNENNESLSSEIVNIVGDYVTLDGSAVRWNDWMILRVDAKSIRTLSMKKKWKEQLIALEEDMTFCQP